MMSRSIARITVHDDIAVIHIDDSRENRITVEFCQSIEAALTEIEKSSSRVVLTIGREKFFCNGIYVPSDRNDNGELIHITRALSSLLLKLLTFPIPTVALVNGHAFGAGLMFALAHDYRVMSSDSGMVCIPVVDLGIMLPSALIELVRTKVGRPQVIREMLLQGKRFHGPEAKEKGIVDETAPTAQLLTTSLQMASARFPKRKHPTMISALKAFMYEAPIKQLEGPLENLRFVDLKEQPKIAPAALAKL